MTHVNETEQKLVSRLLDGELTAEERAELEHRLLGDRRLRAAVDEQREVRDWFALVRVAEGRMPEERPPVGFAARVADQVRRLPSREELFAEASVPGEKELAERGALSLGRMILAAAALIFSVALPVAAGLVAPRGSDRLEAADRHDIERIDRELRALGGKDGADSASGASAAGRQGR